MRKTMATWFQVAILLFVRGSDTLFKTARFSPSLKNVTTSETPLLLTSSYVRRQLAVSYICRFLSIVIANDER
jgi:hypothetical protein